jgi:hypothetical protein
MKAAVNSVGHSLFYNVYYPVRSLFSTHHRKLLLFLIGLITLCSAVLAIISIYLASLFYVETEISSLLTWIGLSMVGIGLLIVCVVGLRGAYYVNVELLLGFFWGVMVFLAPLIIAVITCFDVYLYIDIFYMHFWDQPEFSGLRHLFCPEGTAETTCAAPNTDFAETLTWCERNYNATDCYDVRDEAIHHAVRCIMLFISFTPEFNIVFF